MDPSLQLDDVVALSRCRFKNHRLIFHEEDTIVRRYWYCSDCGRVLSVTKDDKPLVKPKFKQVYKFSLANP